MSYILVTTPTSLQGCIKVLGGSNKEVRAYGFTTAPEVHGSRSPEVQLHQLSTTQVPLHTSTNRPQHSHLFHIPLHKYQYLNLLKAHCDSLNKLTTIIP